jgi:hypothetical protein
MTALPKNWDVISLGALWDAFNEPRRFHTPQATIKALLYCVRQSGIAALKEPRNIERLAGCDERARAQINVAVEALLQKDKAA